MWLSVGCVAYYISHWATWRYRRVVLRRAVSKVMQGSSVVVQRSPEGFVDLLRSLKLPQNVQTNTLLETQKISFAAVDQKFTVNLADWTSYYALKEHHHTEGGEENISVILEAARPADLKKFLKHELSVPMSSQVHVSEHGTAVAWRAGPPFGILMHCSLEEYLTLCLAYCDKDLTMDEDLVVKRIVSVNTQGASNALVESTEGSMTTDSRRDRGGSRGSIQAMLLKSQKERLADTLSCDWSNESLASGASMGTSDFLDLTDQTGGAGGFSESCSIQEDEEEEGSGSGEAPCDLESMFMSSVDGASDYVKPPNILVYCGKKDSARKFQELKSVLEMCVNPECYVIYHLIHDQISKVPWADNSALLVISSDNIYELAADSFTKYFECGGKVLSFGSPFDAVFVSRKEVSQENLSITHLNLESWSDVPLIAGRFCYVPTVVTGKNVNISVLGTNENKLPVILDVRSKADDNAGHAIISQVLLEHDPTEFASSTEMFNLVKGSNPVRLDMLRSLLDRLEIDTENTSVPVLSPSYLVTNNKVVRENFLKSILPRLKDNGVLKSASVSLCFTDTLPTSEVQADLLPVVTDSSKSKSLEYFSEKTYWENWTGSVFGNTLLVTDVIPSTMPLFDALQFSVPSDVGMIAVAGRQTRGKGRGGNAWLSPIGCAMFSLHVRLPVESKLGKCASFLQHITSLAVVESVVTLPGYQDIDLRLKWPNDIYYGDKMKLGGVLVKSTIMDGVLHANIGCGFNVSNKNPTICINDLVERLNKEQGRSLSLCSTSQLIARTVSKIEDYIEDFQQNGNKNFLKQYYSYWLHSKQRVTLDSEHLEATVLGLDQYGFLEVITDQKRTITLQPDGNSFDMMRNLISVKPT